jgi:hypothetical protein
MKMILKGAGQLLYDIFMGKIPSISSIISNMPLIISLLTGLIYVIWESNKNDTREISYPMIGTFIVYVIFIRYLILQLKDTPFSNALYVLSVFPYLFYYIIEKLNLDSNIIPIYDKNIKLAYKSQEDEPHINSINAKIIKSVDDIEKDIIDMEETDDS